MKRVNYIKFLFFLTVAVGLNILNSCENAKYDTLGIHAYIEESIKSTSSKLTVQATGESSMELNIHVSDAALADSHYKLIVDNLALTEYNRINGTSYITLPEEQYILPEDILIKAGEYNAETVNIILKSFTKEMVNSGESYALPLRLVSKDGNNPVMENTGTHIIIAENIVKFNAPQFLGSTGLTSPEYESNPETYSQYTIEVRFQISDTNNRNRGVFSTNNGDQSNRKSVLLRFEDPQSDNNDHPAHSLVQIQLHNSYVNPTHHFEVNKWQHLAVTFDGMTYRIYVNGIDSGKLDCSDPCLKFSFVDWFNSGTWWNNCKILMSQARIWSVARNATQIQNSMTQVSPKAVGLEAYWRMDESRTEEREDGTYTIFEDATGKGHTLETKEKVTWVDGILSTDPSTPWK